MNKPNFYCLKLFSNKIDKVIDISLLDNEEDVLSISIGVNATLKINKLFLQKQSLALYNLKVFTMKELLENLKIIVLLIRSELILNSM